VVAQTAVSALRQRHGATGMIDRGIAAVLAFEAAMTMPKQGMPRIISMAQVLADARRAQCRQPSSRHIASMVRRTIR
jgi:hypothetical protein